MKCIQYSLTKSATHIKVCVAKSALLKNTLHCTPLSSYLRSETEIFRVSSCARFHSETRAISSQRLPPPTPWVRSPGRFSSEVNKVERRHTRAYEAT